jgi:SPP1 gp7 family putative phage head morphogenesis protein
MPPIRSKSGKKITLRAVRANAGIAAAYQRKILALVDDMARSYAWFLRAQYRADPPVLAQDASPAAALLRALNGLFRRWEKNFEEAAPKLADWFAQSTWRRTDAALKKILRDGGYSVKFQITPAMRDVMDATVAENVGLIKSIPAEFHTKVEGMVMRSVTAGRDLQSLTRDLQKTFGITRRRAEFIAHDQNSKATTSLRRAREISIGITEGVWLHSHAGKVPRPTHLKNNGKTFNLETGWHDPDPKVDANIMPGELPRCRCTWRPVVKGFS